MRFDILTLFPEMFEVMNSSITGRAIQNKIIELNLINFREFSKDKQKHVDDTPYGGGAGMVIKPEPIYDAYMSIAKDLDYKPKVIYMSPRGKVFNQQMARELSKEKHLIILCGHYEGVDERVIEEIVDEEISIGDYVLTGGELPALVLADSISRMLPGVLANDEAFTQESHYSSLLEYPQYTKPAQWQGQDVPDILLSGHHANIEKYRREKSLERTYLRRPDMLSKADLGKNDIEFLRKLKAELKKSKE